MTLNIFTDGGARGNPGPAAIGFVIKDTHGKLIHQHGQYIGATTNNVAEYTAVIHALEWLTKEIKIGNWKLEIVNFFLDSALVVNQLNGLFKIKHAPLRELMLKIKIIEPGLGIPITYTHIPRQQNSQADSLVNQALDAAGF